VKVKEIMTKNPIIVPPSTTFHEIQSIFNNNKIWSVYIGDSDRFLGIITRKDLSSRGNGVSPSFRADKIMSKNVITLDENSDVKEAIRIIKDKKINGLGVTKNGKPCGIITKYDIKINYHPKAFENRDRFGSTKTTMTRCNICGEKIEGMPFTCRRCGGRYCGDHRLPESHDCQGLGRIKPKKITFENLIQNLTSSKKDKRKDAAIQLDKQSWLPQTESQKAYFLFAYQQWDNLIALGPPSFEPLISGLIDADIAIQISCIQSLVKLGNPQAIEPLIQKLNDPHSQVRKAVAIALDNFGWIPHNDKERIGLLIAQQKWNDLVKFGKISIDPLSGIIDDENEDVRFQAVTTLCNIRDNRIIGPLIKAVRDRSKKVKITALQGLIDFKDSKIVDDLIIAVNDKDSAIQRIALDGLIQLDTYAVEALIDTLKKIEERNVDETEIKTNIIFALGEIRDARAGETLINIYDTTKSKTVKEAAQKALKKIDLQSNNLKQKSKLYCLNCFSNFIKSKQPLLPFLNPPTVPICRNCKSNKNYLEEVNKVILLLNDMNEPYEFKNGVLSVNWFKIKKPIDMNEIAIVNGTNEDIAELVMKLRNDEDFERERKNKHIPVLIAKNLNISQAKINLLQNTFGNVHVVEKDTINKLGE
jgi:HEAT repeat protein